MFKKSSDLEGLLKKAAELINLSNYTVALTGAGMSTESGIDDFRSPGGLWSRYNPAIYGSYHYFVKDSSKFWEMAFELLPTFDKAKPNPGHLALAKLESLGRLQWVLTQNIDNLHQRAGSKNVLELHGTCQSCTCLKCGQKSTLDELRPYLEQKQVPRCSCGGDVKPDVILFGEGLRPEVLRAANRLARQAELMLVIGTSLDIYPAASLPLITKSSRGKLIFVNQTKNFPRLLANIFLQGQVGEILPRLVEEVSRV